MSRVTLQQMERLPLAERHELWQTRLSRRGLLRAAALSAAGPLLHVPSAGALTSADVPVLARWLAYGRDPSSLFKVNWQVAGPVRAPRVRYGLDSSYGQTAGAEVTPLRTVLGSGRVMTQHYLHARAGDLQPGTTYHYRIEHSGFTGPDATFRTAPSRDSTEPFTFTAVGDQGATPASHTLDRLVARQGPAFHLVAGDLSYADVTGRGLPTDDLRPLRWDRYFQQSDPVSSAVPWMVAAGNHEIEAAYSPSGYGGIERRFRLPTNGPTGCPAVYSFRYSNVGIVSLDANDTTYELSAKRGYTGGRQTRWLASALADLRADPFVDFIVVFFHQCAYAVNTAHGSDGGVRSAWAPIFDKYAVDLVINGHNHAYERTDPLFAGRVRRAAPPGSTVTAATEGTTYVVAGGGGIGLNASGVPDRLGQSRGASDTAIASTLWTSDGSRVAEQVTWSRSRFTGYSILAIDVVPSRRMSTMRLRVLSADGSQVDSVTFARYRPAEGHGRVVAIGAASSAIAAVGTAVTVIKRRSHSTTRLPVAAGPASSGTKSEMGG